MLYIASISHKIPIFLLISPQMSVYRELTANALRHIRTRKYEKPIRNNNMKRNLTDCSSSTSSNSSLCAICLEEYVNGQVRGFVCKRYALYYDVILTVKLRLRSWDSFKCGMSKQLKISMEIIATTIKISRTGYQRRNYSKSVFYIKRLKVANSHVL